MTLFLLLAWSHMYLCLRLYPHTVVIVVSVFDFRKIMLILYCTVAIPCIREARLMAHE